MQNAQIFYEFAKRYWPWLLSAAVISLLAWAFLAGFRIGPEGIGRSASIVIPQVPSKTDIYVDQVIRHTAINKDTETFVSSGTHTVIVHTEGYQPWNEIVEVKRGDVAHLNPIYVPIAPEAKELSAERVTSMRKFTSPLPTATSTRPIEGTCVEIYVFENKVIAKPGVDCVPPPFLCDQNGVCEDTLVYAPTGRIRSVLPYAGRADALVVAAGKTVAVVEIDPREPQFFAPVYTGTGPHLSPFSSQTLVVFDLLKGYEINL